MYIGMSWNDDTYNSLDPSEFANKLIDEKNYWFSPRKLRAWSKSVGKSFYNMFA